MILSNHICSRQYKKDLPNGPHVDLLSIMRRPKQELRGAVPSRGYIVGQIDVLAGRQLTSKAEVTQLELPHGSTASCACVKEDLHLRTYYAISEAMAASRFYAGNTARATNIENICNHSKVIYHRSRKHGALTSADEKVLWLNVSMHYALLMAPCDSFDELANILPNLRSADV